jgi:hypothetical protein
VTRARLLRVACAACLVAALAGAALAKKKKKQEDAPPSTSAILAALDSQGEAIANCALPAAPTGGSANVTARLTISATGKLLNAKITVEPGGAAADEARGCIDRVLAAVAYPPIKDPLITVERSWTFTLKR